MKKNAFYYNDRYFLLPDDCPDVESLLAAHGNGHPFSVTELVEKKCMAPYFVDQYVKKRMLKLKKDQPVYPCCVELMSMADYNQRLREIIPAHCAGCPNFGQLTEKDSSLSGHHEEIALNDVCFFREEAEGGDTDDYLYRNVWIKTFVNNFGRLGLEELIDQGQFETASQRFVEAVATQALEPVPVVFFGKTPKGKYHLAFTALLCMSDALVMDYLMNRLRIKYHKTWEFSSGIPQGFEPVHPEIAPLCRPLAIHAAVNEEQQYFRVIAYASEDQRVGTYLWMARQFGEAALLTACDHFALEVLPEGETLPENTMDPEDPRLVQMIQARCASIPAQMRVYPAVQQFVTTPPGITEDTPEEKVLASASLGLCRTLSLLQALTGTPEEGIRKGDFWSGDDIVSTLSFPVARLIFTDLPFTKPVGTNDLEAEFPYVQAMDAAMSALTSRGLTQVFCQLMSASRIEIDLLVFHLRDFLYTIRRMAPLFAQYPAELYIYTASHTSGGHWKRLDFDMKRSESEPELWNGEELR